MGNDFLQIQSQLQQAEYDISNNTKQQSEVQSQELEAKNIKISELERLLRDKEEVLKLIRETTTPG